MIGVVGNTKIDTGRDWKYIAETELASAERTNMLWPYRTTDLPFASLVFSSIVDAGVVQLNNMMPATTRQASSHLDLLNAIGAKWLVSADTPVDVTDDELAGRLHYLGSCQSPLKPDVAGDPRDMPDGGTFFVYELQNPLGIAFHAGAVRLASREEILRDLIRGDWARHPGMALVDASIAKAALESINKLEGAAIDSQAEPVSVDALTFDRVLLSGRSEHPGLVVLTLADRPFWKVTVNGQPSPIVRTFGGFLGVAVPAGRVVVAFTYVPYDVYFGAAISLLTILGCLGFSIAKRTSVGAGSSPQRANASLGD